MVSSSGSVVERNAYDAFSAVTVYSTSFSTITTSAYSWVFYHQGGRAISLSGQMYFRGREYSTTLGRWAAMDPIGYESHDHNLYRAMANNPIKYNDPTGKIVYTRGLGGAFVFVAGGGLSVLYAKDDCGNFGYFIGAAPQLGLAGGIGFEAGTFSGTLREFANGFSEKVFTHREKAAWYFDGSGSLIDGVWTAAATAKNNGDKLFTEVTNGDVVPVTTGDLANNVLLTQTWSTVNQ